MLLAGIHLIGISTIIFVVGGIAYRNGKQEGIRLAKAHFENKKLEELEKKNPST
ncbi:MAG: hypothetical protein HQM12_01785 [SAR324 cluster bacterium]|nr:hypothetical protein [SAR324 cluster bacterium]MBF0350535.1 hypothetical protein [SAR324 cluster bacterium]